MREDALLTDTLEPTNEPNAVAKIAGIKLCESYNRQHNRDYRSVMPTNLYGPGDNYNLQNSHVIPALIRKFHLSKQIMQEGIQATKQDQKVHGPIPKDLFVFFREFRGSKIKIWGTGTPYREFLHVDDMAAASIHVMNLDRETYQQQTQPMLSHINVGTGQDLTIKQLAETIAKVTGYTGQIEFDTTKPDGPSRKLMDSTRLNNLGWKPKIKLEQGLKQAYNEYLAVSNGQKNG